MFLGHFLMDKRQKILMLFFLKVDLPLLSMFEKLQILDAYFSKKLTTWSSHCSLLILKGLSVDCLWFRLLVEPFPAFPINYYKQFRKNCSNSFSRRQKIWPVLYKSYRKMKNFTEYRTFSSPPNQNCHNFIMGRLRNNKKSRSKEDHENLFVSSAQGSLAHCTQSCKYHNLQSKQEQKWIMCTLPENVSNGWNFTLFKNLF